MIEKVKQEKPEENTSLTRNIVVNGKKVTIRAVRPTNEARALLGRNKRRDIMGIVPANPPWIEKEIVKKKTDLLRSLALLPGKKLKQFVDAGPVDFWPHQGYTKFDIFCVTCGDKQATVWAKDETLKDWCDLHYHCWHDQLYWHGAMAVNISPIDGLIGIECACGNDTRDYRANRTLPPIQKRLMAEHSMKHRDFAMPTSLYISVPA